MAHVTRILASASAAAPIRLTGAARAAALARVPSWKPADASAPRDLIEKTFTFPDFSSAWAFMSRCALAAEVAAHHPEWRNVYNTVHVQLTTHDAHGLSQKDIDFAKQMDAFAAPYN